MSAIPLTVLDSYDWREAFGYAGEPDTCGRPDVRPSLPSEAVSLSPFTRADVTELLGTRDGENDGPPWFAYGRLNDGRWFFLEAGCDYTGWDCQAGGSATVSCSLPDLIQFGMTPEARQAFGIEVAP